MGHLDRIDIATLALVVLMFLLVCIDFDTTMAERFITLMLALIWFEQRRHTNDDADAE